MSGKFFTLPRLLVIFAVVIIVVVGAVWYASYKAPSTSTSSTPTPTPPVSSSTQTATPTPKPVSTPSSSPAPTSPTSNSPTPSPTPTPPATPTPTTLTPSPTPASQPTTAFFNFDDGTPTLSVRQPTPFDQTSNGVTAHFSSPSDSPSHPAFSVQNLNSLAAISTVINSAKFSGLFLWPSTINRDRLDITFSQNLTNISFVFKTAELHDPGPGGTGSPIRLTTYMNSLSTPVGSPITVNGVETPYDNYPEGTLTFNSGGLPFNMVEIDLPYVSAEGATGFIIDNVTVITK
jgi:hypothetical protein